MHILKLLSRTRVNSSIFKLVEIGVIYKRTKCPPHADRKGCASHSISRSTANRALNQFEVESVVFENGKMFVEQRAVEVEVEGLFTTHARNT